MRELVFSAMMAGILLICGCLSRGQRQTVLSGVGPNAPTQAIAQQQFDTALGRIFLVDFPGISQSTSGPHGGSVEIQRASDDMKLTLDFQILRADDGSWRSHWKILCEGGDLNERQKMARHIADRLETH
jgi:hypothetical protein